jgi:protein-tyrosine-phosphatase
VGAAERDTRQKNSVFIFVPFSPLTCVMKTINVLFLCTHNSARSILSEALLNHLAIGASGTRFHAFSAGSSPRENQQPNPLGLQVLHAAGIDTSYLRSKSWDEFAQPDAPHMDLVITVCDNAAGEVCPYWPGQPATAHWGYADPSAVEGSDDDRLQAFRDTLYLIQKRLQLLVDLPADKLQKAMLSHTAKALSQEHA